MAIVGCDFICTNKDCGHCGKMIRLTAPWPLADADEIINHTKNEVEKRELMDLKSKGRRFLCKVFNVGYDNKKIATKAYRLQYWDQNKKTIWMFDLELTSDKIPEQAFDEFKPSDNKEENKNLLSFKQAIEKGIMCPSCNTITRQSRWFTNEE